MLPSHETVLPVDYCFRQPIRSLYRNVVRIPCRTCFHRLAASPESLSRTRPETHVR